MMYTFYSGILNNDSATIVVVVVGRGGGALSQKCPDSDNAPTLLAAMPLCNLVPDGTNLEKIGHMVEQLLSRN